MKSKNVLLGMAGVAMFSSGAMAQKPANIISEVANKLLKQATQQTEGSQRISKAAL